MRLLIAMLFLFVAPALFAQGKDSLAVKAEGGQVFEKVEVEASVDAAQWKQHLEANLLPYIEKAAKKKMKAGTYTVYVRFLVGLDGSISDVKALNNVGYGLSKGAEKVLSTGPKWKPGIYKGKPVRSYHTQPITFVISEI